MSDVKEQKETGIYWFLWFLLFSRRGLMCLLRIAWVVCNNMYCIPVYFLIMTVLSPILLFKPHLYWRLEEIFFDWLLSMVTCWSYTAGYRVVESGDRLERIEDETVVFMPNHQSTADVPLCMSLFVGRRGFTARVMWIMDKIFKYTNFGWVSWMHDDFFILAGKQNRDLSLKELYTHLHTVFMQKNRNFLVLFPEGGFLRKRMKVSKAFAKKNDLPNLECVTLPRMGALEVVFDAIGPARSDDDNGKILKNSKDKKRLTKIVDVTIAYPEGKPLDLMTLAAGFRPPCTTHVHYRIFDIKDIPTDPEALKNWMYELYYDKEKMLSSYYSTGIFPHDMFDKSANPPVELAHDPLRFFILHVFFVVVTWIAWTFIKSLYALVY